MGVATAALSNRGHRIQLTQACFGRVRLRCHWVQHGLANSCRGCGIGHAGPGFTPGWGGVGWAEYSREGAAGQGEQGPGSDPGGIPL